MSIVYHKLCKIILYVISFSVYLFISSLTDEMWKGVKSHGLHAHDSDLPLILGPSSHALASALQAGALPPSQKHQYRALVRCGHASH